MRCRPRTCARPRPRCRRAPPRPRPRRLPASGDALLPPVPRIPQGLSPLHPRRAEAARRGPRNCRRRLAHRPHRHAAGGRHRIRQGTAALALVARRRPFRAWLAAFSAALPRSPVIGDRARRPHRQSLLPLAAKAPYFLAVTVISMWAAGAASFVTPTVVRAGRGSGKNVV